MSGDTLLLLALGWLALAALGMALISGARRARPRPDRLPGTAIADERDPLDLSRPWRSRAP